MDIENIDNNVLTITAVERPTLTVDLVGKRYSVVPPKGAFALSLVRKVKDGDDPTKQVDSLMAYVKMAFTKKDAKDIEARLNDSDDLLDIVHLITLLEALVKRVTGNPTG